MFSQTDTRPTLPASAASDAGGAPGDESAANPTPPATSAAGLPAETEAPDRAGPRFTLVQLRGGAHRLDLRGPLPPGWSGHLSLRLARAGISILEGTAERARDGLWHARLHLEPAAPGVDLAGLDYAVLAGAGGESGPPPALALDAFTLRSVSDRDGSLYLEVHGADCVGFLAGLLKRLSFLALFPERMTIETRDARVSDRFWLKGVGGQAPSPEAQRALEGMLERLTRRS